MAQYLPGAGGAGGAGDNVPLRPEWSGNTLVLKPGNGYDKIVIVSNHSIQTLDLIGRICRENTWEFFHHLHEETSKDIRRIKLSKFFPDDISTLA